MPELLAICDNCGTPFPALDFPDAHFDIQRDISRRDLFMMTFKGRRIRSECLGSGQLTESIDFTEFVSDTIAVLVEPERTIEDLCRFDEVARKLKHDLQAGEVRAEEAPERLRYEAPEFSKLTEMLASIREKHLLYLALIEQTIYLIPQTI